MAENNTTRESDQPNKVQNFAITAVFLAIYDFVALIEFFLLRAIVRITERNILVAIIIAPIFIISYLITPMMIRDKILKNGSKKYLYKVSIVGSILGIIPFMIIIYPFVKDW